jgi:hypothetical protein
VDCYLEGGGYWVSGGCIPVDAIPARNAPDCRDRGGVWDRGACYPTAPAQSDIDEMLAIELGPESN